MVPRALLLLLLAPSSALVLPSSLRARPTLPRTPLVRAAAAASDTPKAPLSVSVLNLSKNIVCGGFLSLPAGVAACALATRVRPCAGIGASTASTAQTPR